MSACRSIAVNGKPGCIKWTPAGIVRGVGWGKGGWDVRTEGRYESRHKRDLLRDNIDSGFVGDGSIGEK